VKQIAKALIRGIHIGIPDRVDIDERPEAVNNRER